MISYEISVNDGHTVYIVTGSGCCIKRTRNKLKIKAESADDARVMLWDLIKAGQRGLEQICYPAQEVAT